MKNVDWQGENEKRQPPPDKHPDKGSKEPPPKEPKK